MRLSYRVCAPDQGFCYPVLSQSAYRYMSSAIPQGTSPEFRSPSQKRRSPVKYKGAFVVFIELIQGANS